MQSNENNVNIVGSQSSQALDRQHEVQCTGIIINQDEIHFDHEGQSIPIDYSVVPDNITSCPNIGCERPDIVRIIDNVPTAVNVGWANMWVHCDGIYSSYVRAICDFVMDRTFREGYALSEAHGDNDHYLVESEQAITGYCGSGSPWGDGRCVAVSNGQAIYPYKLPTRCDRIVINYPPKTGIFDLWGCRVLFFDSTRAGDANGNGTAYFLSSVSPTKVDGIYCVPVDQNADSFAVEYVHLKTTTSGPRPFGADDLDGYNVVMTRSTVW